MLIWSYFVLIDYCLIYYLFLCLFCSTWLLLFVRMSSLLCSFYQNVFSLLIMIGLFFRFIIIIVEHMEIVFEVWMMRRLCLFLCLLHWSCCIINCLNNSFIVSFCIIMICIHPITLLSLFIIFIIIHAFLMYLHIRDRLLAIMVIV